MISHSLCEVEYNLIPHENVPPRGPLCCHRGGGALVNGRRLFHIHAPLKLRVRRRLRVLVVRSAAAGAAVEGGSLRHLPVHSAAAVAVCGTF